MTHYERSSFIVAAVISITVHATAAVYLGHYDAPFADQPQSTDSVMRISLAPASPAAQEPEPEAFRLGRYSGSKKDLRRSSERYIVEMRGRGAPSIERECSWLTERARRIFR